MSAPVDTTVDALPGAVIGRFRSAVAAANLPGDTSECCGGTRLDLVAACPPGLADRPERR